MVDVIADGGDQLFEVMEDAATELVLGEVAEEAFDHVEPRGRGGAISSLRGMRERVFRSGRTASNWNVLLFCIMPSFGC